MKKIVKGLIESTLFYFQNNFQAQRDDIAKLKEEIAKLVQALTPTGGN